MGNILDFELVKRKRRVAGVVNIRVVSGVSLVSSVVILGQIVVGTSADGGFGIYGYYRGAVTSESKSVETVSRGLSSRGCVVGTLA